MNPLNLTSIGRISCPLVDLMATLMMLVLIWGRCTDDVRRLEWTKANIEISKSRGR